MRGTDFINLLMGIRWTTPGEPWNVVFGHHPVYSQGSHGDTDLVQQFIWKVLFEQEVDFYLSGHDHHLNALRNGDLNFSATLQGDLSAQSLLVFTGLDYTINDNWSVSSQIISISAKAGSFLTFFDEDLRLGITLTYTF